jgi:ABC-type glutathione transport system ATPase component
MTVAEPTPHIVLDDVSMTFGAPTRALPGWLARLVSPREPVVALNHVNIAVARGESVGLVGARATDDGHAETHQRRGALRRCRRR